MSHIPCWRAAALASMVLTGAPVWAQNADDAAPPYAPELLDLGPIDSGRVARFASADTITFVRDVDTLNERLMTTTDPSARGAGAIVLPEPDAPGVRYVPLDVAADGRAVGYVETPSASALDELAGVAPNPDADADPDLVIDPGPRLHAARFVAGEVVALTTPDGWSSIATAVAEDGDLIVGAIFDHQTSETYAVVWDDGALVWLDDYVDPTLGYTLQFAYDLSPDGVIVGTADHDGDEVVVALGLFGPVPEGLALVTGGGGGGGGGGGADPLPQAQSYCLNGDLELGTRANWDGDRGQRHANNFGVNWNTSGMADGRQTIMDVGDGDDPQLDTLGVTLPVVPPNGGDHALRLGNAATNSEAERAYYDVHVDPADGQFHYNMAVVLQDPGHDHDQQPYFEVEVFRGHTMNIFARKRHERHVADGNDPYFLQASSLVLYTPWRCRTIDLDNWRDEDMRVVFTTSDCSQGGHSGYVYVDNLCGDAATGAAMPVIDAPAELCADDTIVDGSASQGIISHHFWSVQESDPWWQAIGPEVSEWRYGTPSTLDVRAFAASQGLQLACGDYVRVKLAVGNECSPWNDTTKLVHLVCPEVDAGPDQVMCIGDSVVLAPYNQANGNYMWWTLPSGQTLTGGTLLQVSPSATTTYTLHARDADGCEADDAMTVHVDVDDPFIKLGQFGVCNCTSDRRLRATIMGGGSGYGATYLWNTGATTQEIVVPNPSVPTTYTVTVTNQCGQSTRSTVVMPDVPLSLAVPTGFTPNGDGVNDRFTITHLGPPPLGRVYGQGVRLEIYDRWGMLIYQQDATCTNGPHVNDSLAWDGRFQGQAVQEDAYVFKLYGLGCDGTWSHLRTGTVNLQY